MDRRVFCNPKVSGGCSRVSRKEGMLEVFGFPSYTGHSIHRILGNVEFLIYRSRQNGWKSFVRLDRTNVKMFEVAKRRNDEVAGIRTRTDVVEG